MHACCMSQGLNVLPFLFTTVLGPGDLDQNAEIIPKHIKMEKDKRAKKYRMFHSAALGVRFILKSSQSHLASTSAKTLV